MKLDGWRSHIPGPQPTETLNKWVVVELEDGYRTAPIWSNEVDWNCPGDQVMQYRIVRVNKARKP